MPTDKDTGATLVEVADYGDRKSYQVYVKPEGSVTDKLIGVVTKYGPAEWRGESKHKSLYDHGVLRQTCSTRSSAVRFVVQMDVQQPAALARKAEQDAQRVTTAQSELHMVILDAYTLIEGAYTKQELNQGIREIEARLAQIARPLAGR